MEQTGEKRLLRTQKKRNLQKARRLFLILATVFVLLLLFVVILVQEFFVLREIRVDVESSFYPEEKIVEATGLTEGRNMFSFSDESVRSEMLRRLSYFSDVRVKKIFPSTLELSFEEIPGTMYVEVAGSYYILAPDFYVIARAESEEEASRGRMHLICTSVYRCVVGEKICMKDTEQLALLETICGYLADNGATEQLQYLDATNRFSITLNYAGKWDIELGDTTELSYKIRMFLKVVEKAQLDYGPDTGGKIDITGINEAITKIYDGSAQVG